jgi:type I restriction enzyme S subunit
MADDWQTMTVADLGRVVTGKTPPTAKPQLYGSGYPFITPTDIGSYRYCEAARQVSEEGRESQRNLLLPAKTVCVTCIASVGKMCMTDRPSFTNQQINSVIADETRHDPFFVYYLLQTRVEHLKAIAGGAATPIINKTAFSEIEVSAPPLPVQRRIAGILSAYDELMENSQRRIRLLEAMARALYREWFVHFRFPGHEKHPRVASPLGDIPQGWEVKKLADVAEVNRAQINARSAPDELHYIDIASVSPGQIDSITSYVFADAPGRARRIVQHGDMLWSCVRPNRRSHAQVMHPEPDTIASTGFAVLTATKVPFTFLYFATTTDDFVAFLTNNSTGSAYPAVSGATFEKADLLIPPAPLLKKFGDATIPIAEQIHALQRQIQNLRRTRDLLLPRLLSGQVELKTEDA